MRGGIAAFFALSTEVATAAEPAFPRPLQHYADQGSLSTLDVLVHRIQVEPLNLAATLIFLGAVVHTFLTSVFRKIAHGYEREVATLPAHPDRPEILRRQDQLRFRAQLFSLLGEVEAIFALWLVPLFVCLVCVKGWPSLLNFAATVNTAEPSFVVAIMVMTGSRPVLRLAERALAQLARIGGSSPAAWWLSILTVGPLFGSFITEPGAMTICALLLRQHVYGLSISRPLRYGTLGLLFVGISVGGTLSHFAAPPVVMVAGPWRWGFLHMLSQFGWKAALGIALSNALYFRQFHRELMQLRYPPNTRQTAADPIPWRVTVTNLLLIGWTVAVSHYATLVVLGLLFFLAFAQATQRHQGPLPIRGPLLVGLFLTALIFHGLCQQWWLQPALRGLSEGALMLSATVLTGFNDNAAVTYLASLVPDLSDSLKYAVMAGAVTGGGLTVIANAPNPVGENLLGPSFGENGISPFGLFAAALAPTVIVGACFMLLR